MLRYILSLTLVHFVHKILTEEGRSNPSLNVLYILHKNEVIYDSSDIQFLFQCMYLTTAENNSCITFPLLRLVTCNRLVNLGISKQQHLYLRTKKI